LRNRFDIVLGGLGGVVATGATVAIGEILGFPHAAIVPDRLERKNLKPRTSAAGGNRL
jgi:hypothetical protein